MSKMLLLIGFLYLLCPFSLFAHGDLHKQITQISERIKKEPDNANLYLKRGQLYAQHSEPQKAKKDLQKARLLNPSLLITDLLLSKAYFKNKQLNEGLKYVNIYLKSHPNEADGLILRANIYQQLKKEPAAKKDLELAFSNLKDPNPGHYISIADASLRADKCNFEEALEWLEKGQQQFGFDIVLQEKTAEILVTNHQYDRAIIVVDEILTQFPRKEKWLFKKGTIYEKSHQKEAALSNYNAALETLQNLPQRIQRTKKMKELKASTMERIQLVSNQ